MTEKIYVLDSYALLSFFENEDGAEVEIYSLIRSFLLTFVEVNLALALQAAKIKSKYAIALGDCFCAATAKELGASVVTGDSKYERLGKEVKIMWLPKKQRKQKNR